MSISPCGGYIFKIGNLVVLQEYEVDRSSSGVQEILRRFSKPLVEMRVGGDADKCLSLPKYLDYPLDRPSFLSKNHN